MTKLSLRHSFFILMALFLTAFTVVSLFLLHKQETHQTERNLEILVSVRTNAAALDLARTLEQDWRDLVYLSSVLPNVNRETIPHILNGASGDRSRISWLGFATIDGTVVAATDGLLVGETVSTRPWFINGLNGSFAGDIHDAVLLARLLDPDGIEPLRFIDFAVPVYDHERRAIGVLGMHINASWLNEYLEESANSLGLDIYLLNPDNSISARSTHSTNQPNTTQANINSILADRDQSYSELISEVTYGDMPSFDWRMVGILNINNDNVTNIDADTISFRTIFVSVFLFLGISIVYVRIFISPLSELGWSAQRISDGYKDYPAENYSSLEASQISKALITSQLRNISDDG